MPVNVGTGRDRVRARIAARPASSPNRLRASLVDLTFGIWAAALCFALSSRVLNSDGDLPRHVVMGRHILEDGVRITDTFSHTRAGSPFLAYEWGSQVVLAAVHAAGGLAAVLVFAALWIAAVYALLVRFLLRRGVDPMLAYLAAIAAALLGSAHWSARPHLFTFAAVVLLLHWIEPREAPPRPRGRGATIGLLGAGVLFAVWANVHPGFVLGLAVLGAAAAGSFIESRLRAAEEAARWRGRAVYFAAGLLIAAAATLATPFGVGLHLHIIELLANPFLMSETDEFQRLDLVSVYGAVFLLVLALAAAGLVRGRTRPSFDRIAVVLLLLAGAFTARRNIPLFGLIGVPLLALLLDRAWRGVRARALANARTVFEEGERIATPGRYIPWIAGAFVVLGLASGRIESVRLLPEEFDSRTFPVAAVAEARAAGLEGRIFNEFTWGGYLLYAWPEQRIFIDGMTDFFGEELARSYLRILRLAPGWEAELERYDVSIAILPPEAPLAGALGARAWRSWYTDETATILLRPER